MSSNFRRKKRELIREMNDRILYKSSDNNSWENILTLEGDEYYKSISSLIVEMENFNTNGVLLTEESRLLLEWDWFNKLKSGVKDSWSSIKEKFTEMTSKMSKEQQEAVAKERALVLKITKQCVKDIKKQNKKAGITAVSNDDLEQDVKNCVSSEMSDNGPSIIGRLNKFFTKTKAGKIITAALMVLGGAMATGVLQASLSDTTIDGPSDDSQSDNTFDNQLSHDLPNDSNTFDSANTQGVTPHLSGDGVINNAVHFDTGSSDLSQDEVQKIQNIGQELLQNVHDRLDAGHTDITINLEAQGNASNDSGQNWNHNNTTGSDNLNHERASVVGDALQDLVKQLQDLGVHVNVNTTVGDQGNQVTPNSNDAQQTQTGFISHSVNSEAPTTTTTTTDFNPGLPYPFVNTYPTEKAGGCSVTILDGEGKEKEIVLKQGDRYYINGGLVGGEFKPSQKGEQHEAMVMASTIDEKTQKTSNMLLNVVIDGKEYEFHVPCGGEIPMKPDPRDPEPDPRDPEPNPIPPDFLEGNRNMQLAYLASNFLPEGQDFWSNLGLKKGTVIPSGFLDVALGQGKVDRKAYFKKFFEHLQKEKSFTKDFKNWFDWFKVVNDEKNKSLIRWVRNTRKNIGPFIKALKKEFPEFKIGDRNEAKVGKPGQLGKAMGLSGGEKTESFKNKGNLITEVTLGNTATQAGFDEKLFMKNLPKFMSMLSSMYYSTKGTQLPYDKAAVVEKCKDYGCNIGSQTQYKQTKSKDYKLKGIDKDYMSEEINRIKQLMK